MTEFDQDQSDRVCVGGKYAIRNGQLKFLPIDLHDPVEMNYIGIEETKAGTFYMYQCPECNRKIPL